MSKNQIYWLAQVLGWGAVGLREVINYTFFIGGKFSWTYVTFFSMHMVFGLGLTHLLHLWLRKSRAFEKPTKSIVMLGIALVLGSASALGLFSVVLSLIIQKEATLEVQNILGYFLGASMNWIQVTTPWILFYFLYKFMDQNNTIRNEKLHAINLAKTTELELLKSQLNPHFLFNALNSIKALVLLDPQKARIAIIKLSELLRFSLNYEKQPFISLSAELEEVEKYLELEKIRFAHRLDYSLQIENLSKPVLVPPAIVLTLVENAIKHGIAREPAGGIIRVNSMITQGKLIIKVENTGCYQPLSNIGIGLKNVKERLKSLYGSQALFSIYNTKDNKVEASITMDVDPLNIHKNISSQKTQVM